MQCKGTTGSGARCRHKVVAGKPDCGRHTGSGVSTADTGSAAASVTAADPFAASRAAAATTPAKKKPKRRKKSSKAKTTTDSIATKVADRMIAKIEEGISNGTGWKAPWTFAAPPRNPVSGTTYKGINPFILIGSAGVEETGDMRFITGYQAKTLAAAHHGVTVKEYDEGVKAGLYEPAIVKGSKSTQIHFAKRVSKKDRTPEDPDNKRMVFVWRDINLFHVDTQINPSYAPAKPEPANNVTPGETITGLIDALGAEVAHGGNDAYYSPGHHRIRLPHPSQFTDEHSYAATAIHELCHWTKGDGVGRDSDFGDVGGGVFGTDGYAREEIRTEMAASIVRAALGVDHAADTACHDSDQASEYVANWLHTLKNDPREITDAARDAQRIADHILGRARTAGLLTDQSPSGDQ